MYLQRRSGVYVWQQGSTQSKVKNYRKVMPCLLNNKDSKTSIILRTEKQYQAFILRTHTSNKPAKPRPPRSSTQSWVITYRELQEKNTQMIVHCFFRKSIFFYIADLILRNSPWWNWTIRLINCIDLSVIVIINRLWKSNVRKPSKIEFGYLNSVKLQKPIPRAWKGTCV